MDVVGTIKKGVTWPFLDEPLYRWFLFIIILGALLSAWAGALRMARSVE